MAPAGGREPELGPDEDFEDTSAPVTRDPETGEQRYPEHVGGTEEAPAPPTETDDEHQAEGTGH